MSRVQLLLATNKPVADTLYRKMNIQSDLVVGAQGTCEGFSKLDYHGYTIEVIQTTTVGVGLNRNIALSRAQGDICVLCDDDITYVDGYVDLINRAFDQLKKADVIIFNIATKGEDPGRRQNTTIRRVGYHNFLNYGSARIAFRLSAIKKKNIWFTTLFGGGALFSAGEDVTFLKSCLDNGLKIYAVPDQIGTVEQYDSSWFSGYNDKYFIDKGALIAMNFTMARPLLSGLYFPLKFSKITPYTFQEIRKLMYNGMKQFDDANIVSWLQEQSHNNPNE